MTVIHTKNPCSTIIVYFFLFKQRCISTREPNKIPTNIVYRFEEGSVNETVQARRTRRTLILSYCNRNTRIETFVHVQYRGNIMILYGVWRGLVKYLGKCVYIKKKLLDSPSCVFCAYICKRFQKILLNR